MTLTYQENGKEIHFQYSNILPTSSLSSVILTNSDKEPHTVRGKSTSTLVNDFLDITIDPEKSSVSGGGVLRMCQTEQKGKKIPTNNFYIGRLVK